jgi:hypothetical protein
MPPCRKRTLRVDRSRHASQQILHLAKRQHAPDHALRHLLGGLLGKLVPLDENAIEPGGCGLQARKDQPVRLLDEDPALAVDVVNEPEQRHQWR